MGHVLALDICVRYKMTLLFLSGHFELLAYSVSMSMLLIMFIFSLKPIEIEVIYLNEFTNSINILLLLIFVEICSQLSGLAYCVFVYMSVSGHEKNLHLSDLDDPKYIHSRCFMIHDPGIELSKYPSLFYLNVIICIQVLLISML